MIQMNLIKFPINRIWVKIFLIFNDIIKTTAAFVLNKFLFIIWFKYTQNIYTLSEETFAHICVLYFDAKAILQNP